MPIFQMGKFTPNALKLGALSSSILLSACTLDKSSNNTPVFDEVPVSTTVITVGETYNDQLVATDADGDILLYTVTNEPSWLEITQNGKLSSAVLTDSDIGTFTVTFTATDPDDSVTTTLTYAVVNSLPTAPSIGAASTTLFTDTDFSAVVSATDAGQAPLSFSIVSSTLNSEATDWLTIKSEGSSYKLVGTPNQAQAGETVVVVSVTDGMDSVESTFTITAEIPPPNEAPSVPTLDTYEATEGVAYSAEFSASDPEEDVLTFSLDTSKLNPTWLSLSGTTLSGTPTTQDMNANNAVAVFVIVEDGININDAEEITINLTATPPTALMVEDSDDQTTGSNISAIDGGLLIGAKLSATEDTDDDTLVYSITPDTSWLAVNSITGALSGTPQLADVGTNTFIATVADFNDHTTSLEFTVEVAAKPVINVAPQFITNSDGIIYKAGPKGGVDVEYGPLGETLAADAIDNNDGDVLTFSRTNEDGEPTWLAVAGAGDLSGLITTENNSFNIEVSDGEFTDSATLKITRAYWNTAHLSTSAVPVGREFSAVFGGNNGHQTQDTLSYEKIAGDDDNGLFSIVKNVDTGITSLVGNNGVMTAADIGDYKMQFSVTNGHEVTTTTVVTQDWTVQVNVVPVFDLGVRDNFNTALNTEGWVNETTKNFIPVNSGVLKMKNGVHAIKYFDSTGMTGLTLKYRRKVLAALSGDFIVEWSGDNVTWNELENTNVSDASALIKTIALPVEAEGQEYLAIRIRNTSTANAVGVNIDWIELTPAI